jgi:DNA-binding transcriptional LysR family regulator
MTLQQLRYFLEACRTGSFTAAADALYVAQPSIGQQIRRLEEEVGARLFVRTGRHLELTPAGETLRANAMQVLAAVDATETAMRVSRKLEGGSASLGTFGTAQQYQVQSVITSFVARHPNVEVRVVGQHSLEIIEQVLEGGLEAGLVTLPVSKPALVVEPVMCDEVLYTALPGPDTRQPMGIRRLASIRLITWPAVVGWRDSIRRQLKQWADGEGVELGSPVEVEHIESALDLASAGLGGTYTLRTIAESGRQAPHLEYVSFEQPIYDTYAFIWRRDHKLSRATAELVRLVRTHMEGYGRPVRPDA